MYGCSFVIWALGLALLLLNLIIGAMVVIIAILTIFIIYVYQRDYEEPDPSIQETNLSKEPSYQSLIEVEEKSPVSEVTPSSFQTFDESEISESTKELQQRIKELEERVQSLKEELARDPASVSRARLESPEMREGEEENEEAELSEKAIQQLLETLDEKFAKGAISEQLYTRLRDKYIARMKKSKGKREASAKRGTKDSSTGDH
jgi:uncharacterized membrane protein